MDSARGQLLIAGPSLIDPNFWRTVVLVVEHSEEGAFGLVLNRPSETSVGEAVPELEELLDPAEALFIGGPVQPSSVVILGQFEDPGDAALLAFDDVGVLGAASSLEEMSVGMRRARAFVGHAGWGAGQLDVRARARRLDPRAGEGRGRVRFGRARPMVGGAHAQRAVATRWWRGCHRIRR